VRLANQFSSFLCKQQAHSGYHKSPPIASMNQINPHPFRHTLHHNERRYEHDFQAAEISIYHVIYWLILWWSCLLKLIKFDLTFVSTGDYNEHIKEKKKTHSKVIKCRSQMKNFYETLKTIAEIKPPNRQTERESCHPYIHSFGAKSGLNLVRMIYLTVHFFFKRTI
jgi:hypothetical protein